MPEQPTARKVLEQEEQRLEPKIDLREEAGNLPVSAEENYLRRKAEVTQQDYEEFLLYKEAKERQTEAAQPHNLWPTRPGQSLPKSIGGTSLRWLQALLQSGKLQL